MSEATALPTKLQPLPIHLSFHFQQTEFTRLEMSDDGENSNFWRELQLRSDDISKRFVQNFETQRTEKNVVLLPRKEDWLDKTRWPLKFGQIRSP